MVVRYKAYRQYGPDKNNNDSPVGVYPQSMRVFSLRIQGGHAFSSIINQGDGYHVLDSSAGVTKFCVGNFRMLRLSYLPVIPTSDSRLSVKKARMIGGPIAKMGKKIFHTSRWSSSMAKSERRLFLSVTVMIGNDVDRVRTGNSARK